MTIRQGDLNIPLLATQVKLSKDRNVILDIYLIYFDNPTQTEKTQSFQAHIQH